MTMKRNLNRLVSAACVATVLGSAPLLAAQEPAADSSQDLAETLEQAYKHIGADRFREATRELERASALAEGPCGECLLGFSHVYAANKKWNRSLDAARQALPLLKSPGLQARAYDQIGIALVAQGGRGALAEAEEALRRGADLGGPWGGIARYNLAEVLVRQRRWAEAVAEARRYLQEAGPAATAAKQARIVLCLARTQLPQEPQPEPIEHRDPARAQEGVTRPEILFQVKPVYTLKARKVRTAGHVILEAIIDEEGCVTAVRPLQELPNGLTETAMDALRHWVFSPATLAEKPVKVYYVLTIAFSVQGNAPSPWPIWWPGS